MTLNDYVHKLAYNQHGGIMGYVRNSAGTLDGPRILDVFVVNQKLTCAELEKAAARMDDEELDREMGFRGKVVTWAIETGGPNALLRRGIRKTDFPIGEQLTIKGFRAKNGSPTANANTITLPDGRRLFAGSSGNGAPDAGDQ